LFNWNYLRNMNFFNHNLYHLNWNLNNFFLNNGNLNSTIDNLFNLDYFFCDNIVNFFNFFDLNNWD
jgi:hypothetical protein